MGSKYSPFCKIFSTLFVRVDDPRLVILQLHLCEAALEGEGKGEEGNTRRNDHLGTFRPDSADVLCYPQQNWSPAKTSASYDAFNVVDVSTNWDVFGFLVMGGMVGEEKLWLNLKGASFSDEDFQYIARELELLTGWLVNHDNWEKKAEEFRAL